MHYFTNTKHFIWYYADRTLKLLPCNKRVRKYRFESNNHHAIDTYIHKTKIVQRYSYKIDRTLTFLYFEIHKNIWNISNFKWDGPQKIYPEKEWSLQKFDQRDWSEHRNTDDVIDDKNS